MSENNFRVLFLQFARRHGALIALALQALLAGILIGAVVFAAVQIVPVYFKNYEFETAARKEAQMAATNLSSDDAIRDDISQKAQALGLPVEVQNIQVKAAARESGAGTLDTVLDPSTQPSMVGNVDIDVSYAVPVEFPGWTFRLNFHLHADDHHI